VPEPSPNAVSDSHRAIVSVDTRNISAVSSWEKPRKLLIRS